MSQYMKKNLGRGFIQKSSSATEAGFSFVKKKDGFSAGCADFNQLDLNLDLKHTIFLKAIIDLNHKIIFK